MMTKTFAFLCFMNMPSTMGCYEQAPCASGQGQDLMQTSDLILHCITSIKEVQNNNLENQREEKTHSCTY